MSKIMNIAIISKLKQGDIVKAMKERNWTQGKTAEFLGVSQQTFGRLLNLKWVPKNFPEDLTVKLLELTGKLPDELFPEAFREPEFLSLDKTAIAYAQGNPELVAGLIPKQLNAASSDDLIDRVELQAAFEKVLPTLTPRQQLVIRGRFFEDRTLEDVAKEMGISRDRVRQIEAKALRDLRHPSRSRILKPFVKV